eukprot:4212947-Pyramimonas_sp.AAC.1
MERCSSQNPEGRYVASLSSVDPPVCKRRQIGSRRFQPHTSTEPSYTETTKRGDTSIAAKSPNSP